MDEQTLCKMQDVLARYGCMFRELSFQELGLPFSEVDGRTLTGFIECTTLLSKEERDALEREINQLQGKEK